MRSLNEIYGFRHEGPLVGIEVEQELRRAIGHTPPGWLGVGDGSLRGDHQVEWVLRNPLAKKDAFVALDRLYEAVPLVDVRTDCLRSGVHIHINVGDMEWNHVMNFITLYMCLETELVRYCGTHREGNLFCLRGRDAEFIYPTLRHLASTGMVSSVCHDNLRYYSLNLKALGEHGSLEFRAMHFPVSKAKIKRWIRVLLDLRESAQMYESPSEILGSFSENRIMGFAHIVCPSFEKHWSVDAHSNILSDLRRSQEFAFADLTDVQARGTLNDIYKSITGV